MGRHHAIGLLLRGAYHERESVRLLRAVSQRVRYSTVVKVVVVLSRSEFVLFEHGVVDIEDKE